MSSLSSEPDNMGCISSKAVSGSFSFQKELNKSMKRSANGIEELAISGNIVDVANDQFVALVSTANSVSCKHRSGSFSDKSNKPVVEPDSTLTKTKVEFKSSLEQGGGAKQAGLDPKKGSRSCHLLPMNEDSCPSVESFHGVEEKERNHKGVGCAKSFHTIEEFDALIEKLKLSREQQIGYDGEGDVSGTEVRPNHFQSSSHASDRSGDRNDKQEKHTHMKDRTTLEADSFIEENSTSSVAENSPQ